MILSLIGIGVVLALFALGLKCVRSKHPDDTPFLDAANGTDSVIGSVGCFSFVPYPSNSTAIFVLWVAFLCCTGSVRRGEGAYAENNLRRGVRF